LYGKLIASFGTLFGPLKDLQRLLERRQTCTHNGPAISLVPRLFFHGLGTNN